MAQSGEAEAKSSSSGGAGALAQFCVLAKTTTGKAVVALIQEVLKHQTIFVFGELLQHPNIQAIKGTDLQPYLDLLHIFAYGTYQDYVGKKLPALDKRQMTKLKQLSLVTMASKQKVLEYKQLLSELDISNVRELEDMIIDCIYQGLIVGKLDQRKEQVLVEYASGRDISPSDIDAMNGQILSWVKTSQNVLDLIDDQIRVADKEFLEKRQHAVELESEIAELRKKADVKGGKGGKGRSMIPGL